MITGMGDARIVRLSLRVYSLLLASYPQSFRQQYSAHMLQAFGDYTRRVYLQRGLPGLLWWWALTLFDFLNSVVEEHLQMITSTTKEKFIRLGGWAWMLAGVNMFVAIAFGGFYETSFGSTRAYESIQAVLWTALPLLLSNGFFALRAKYRESMGSLGNIALILGGSLSLVSFIALLATAALTSNDAVCVFFIFGPMVAMIAMMLFGIDALRERYLPRWGSFPFIAGLIPVLAFIAQIAAENSSPQITSGTGNPTLIDQLLEYAPLIFGVGVFLIGYMLQGEGKAAEKAV